MVWEFWRTGRGEERFPVPHFNKGTGVFNAVANLSLSVQVTSSASVVVTAFDVVRTLQGGVEDPTYRFYMARSSDSYAAGSVLPQNEQLSFDVSDAGVVACKAKVSDGTNTTNDIPFQVTVSIY